MQTELIGAGFMIGSAFAIILPEGFEVLYAGAVQAHSHDTSDSASQLEDGEAHGHRRRLMHGGGHDAIKLPCPKWAPGAALLAGFLAMMLFEYLHHSMEGKGSHLPHAHVRSPPDLPRAPSEPHLRTFRLLFELFTQSWTSAAHSRVLRQRAPRCRVTAMPTRSTHTLPWLRQTCWRPAHGHPTPGAPPRTRITARRGPSCVRRLRRTLQTIRCGLAMQCASPAHAALLRQELLAQRPRGVKLSRELGVSSSHVQTASTALLEAEPDSHGGPMHSNEQPCARTSRSVVTALLIHAAADGLAVGVAHMSDSMRLAVAIGMAMVLHKGPVAFGLVSFLLSQGCSLAAVWQVRRDSACMRCLPHNLRAHTPSQPSPAQG